jgi:hypothetical protein
VQSKARMGLIAGLTGASLGTMIVIYTRALRKVALFSSECSSRARADAAALSHTKSTAAHSPLTIACCVRTHAWPLSACMRRRPAVQSRGSTSSLASSAAGGVCTSCCRRRAIARQNPKSCSWQKWSGTRCAGPTATSPVRLCGAARDVARAPLRSSLHLSLPISPCRSARRVQGTLDEKYRAMLGSSYAKIFPES